MRGFALVLLAAAPAAEMRYFAYERPLVSQAAGQSCVALDAQVFQHAAAGVGDLRLYRDGVETPYVVRRMEEEQPAAVRVAPVNLGTRDGRVVFDAEMPEGRYKDLELAVDGRDFLATVTVTGGRTQGGVGTKLGEYTIFDLTGQGLGRSTVLHLPQSDLRYLHFEVAGPVGAKSFTGVSVTRGVREEARYVTVASSGAPVAQGRDTVFRFTVDAKIPVDRLVVEPGAQPAEFSRDVAVSVGEEPARDGADGPVVEQMRLMRVHRTVGGRRVDEEALQFPLQVSGGVAPHRVAVTIHNGDDRPLEVKSVRLAMVERDLCFDAAAGGSYVLYYGDAALEAPVYEYARLFAPANAPQRAGLGAEMANPGHVARPDARPFTERHGWLLWVGLVGVLAVLGMVALRTAKTVRT